MRKIILLFKFMIILIPSALYAQSKVVTGTVRDVGGALPGASVIEKGVSTNGTVTDVNGKFKLTLRGSSNTLIVRFIGYSNQEFKVTANGNIDIILASKSQSIEEVLITGFGTTKRITNTGAASGISASTIRTVPTANVQNTLAGRLPGFFSQQSSGQPGKDASDFFIRGVSSLNPAGNQPLIIVDDIEYNYDQLQQINVNEIESITILKDASTTAIYGIKGANGVLVVTTRRGKSGSPKFNLRVEGGVQSPTRTPKFLNSYETALLINEAFKNDGLEGQFQFTQEDLDHFKNGTDKYIHPDVDWYNEIFKKYSLQTNSNLDISGGSEQVKYFISGGARIENGLNRDFSDPQNLVNTNYTFKRYNFRSNFDLKATKTLNIRVDVTTRFSDLNQPHALSSVGQIYDFKSQTPFSSPVLNPNGSYAYAYSRFNPSQLPTLNARLGTGGYDHSRRTDFNALLGLTQKLDVITEGLSLTARVAYSSVEQFTKIASRGTIPSFHYFANGTYLKNPTGSFFYSPYVQSASTDISMSNLNLQIFSNYDRTFGKNHHLTGLLLLTQISKNVFRNVDDEFFTKDLIGVPQKFRGFSFKTGYDYKGRYLIDFNAAYNGTDRFAAGHRFGWFPALSVGYRLSEEPFFKKIFPVFSLFKLRASYGLVGSDAAPNSRYVYTQQYIQEGDYGFGESQSLYNRYYEGNLGNDQVVWEKNRKTNIGVDMNFLNDKFSVTFDVFRDIRYDQLITPGSVSSILGVALPAVNLGKTRNQGFDGQVGYNTSIGKVQFSTNFVFSYAKNKILFMDEPSNTFLNLRKTGLPINQPFGYKFAGYYTPEEVANVTAFIAANGSNKGNPDVAVPYGSIDENGVVTTVQPGDLKYAENQRVYNEATGQYQIIKDGIINVYDRAAIGNPNIPNTTLGLTLGAAYKGFSVSILFQGSFGYSFAIQDSGIEPFVGQFQPIHQERWTPSTAATAAFPRLTTVSSSVNSAASYMSDYWLVNARYVRLKTIDLGYQLPTTALPFKLNNARIYLSAYNLFTWTNYTKYQQDPEIKTNTAGDAYINQRVINLGVQLGF